MSANSRPTQPFILSIDELRGKGRQAWCYLQVKHNPCLSGLSVRYYKRALYNYIKALPHVGHGEIGCSKWKKTLAYLLVLPGSRARIVRCGGRYDPQLVKRSSE